MWASATIFALICTGCIPMTPEVVGRTTTGRNIVQMPLAWSNSFLIEGHPPILIDAGSSGDESRLELMLEDLDTQRGGSRPDQVGATDLTGSHDLLVVDEEHRDLR